LRGIAWGSLIVWSDIPRKASHAGALAAIIPFAWRFRQVFLNAYGG
jgi:hypothetical protein